MTNEEINEIKLKELEERIKKLEDKVFDTWLGQYDPEIDISEEPAPPFPSTQGCSLEEQLRQINEYAAYMRRHGFQEGNSGTFKIG